MVLDGEGGGDGAGGGAGAGARRRCGRWWPEPVGLSAPTLAVAAHPWAPDQLIAGSWGALCLVGHQ